MKHVADLKSFLDERIAELKQEIEALQEELEVYERAMEGVDAVLTTESFKSAADLIKEKEGPVFKPISEKFSKKEEKSEKKEFEIKDKLGKLLGIISVFGNTISIIPEKGLLFLSSVPPFQSFFEGKILKRMITEDEQAIKEGSLAEAEKISVNVIKDDADTIKNIIIQNFRKYDRMMDIVNTITWTFRTIYEEETK
ncbi:MAG TPA: hypothetical protein VMV49_08905 [Candidatus Deferrimicrobium sp.]|nr:hypothetical protein [Candidatus Deferrimicrobium sp.]